MPMPQTLHAAPSGVVRSGEPCTGRYAGSLDHIDWQGLSGEFSRSPLWRKFHHKRWQFVGINTPECVIGAAMVDLGWCGAAFAYLFDRNTKRILIDYSGTGLSGIHAKVGDSPYQQAESEFRQGGNLIRYHRIVRDHFRLELVVGKRLKVFADLDYAGSPPLMSAIGPIKDGGCAHSTVKSSAIKVSGIASINNRLYSLDQGIAYMDYSNGLLARDTRWYWASGHAFNLGFNLQQGYFGTQENVLWLDNEMIPLGAANFEFDRKNPMAPWHITTADSLVDLHFIPDGMRAENKNLLVAVSQYAQPIGHFSGTVRRAPDATPVEFSGLPGVTEDHHSVW